MKRRGLLKLGFLAAAAPVIPWAVSPVILFCTTAAAKDKAVQDVGLFKPLIEALRRTDKPVCKGAANGLANRRDIDVSYNIHLRNASLTTQDAGLIATALNDLHKAAFVRLESFSVSYNPEMYYTGIKALLDALPNHITELGLVGCNLDDQCANSITAFLERSHSLTMVCVEENDFSPSVKSAIRNATQHLSGCVTIT